MSVGDEVRQWYKSEPVGQLGLTFLSKHKHMRVQGEAGDGKKHEGKSHCPRGTRALQKAILDFLNGGADPWT